MKIIDRVKQLFSPKQKTTSEPGRSIAASIATNHFLNNVVSDVFDGGKFPGSFGITKDFHFVDYWVLRTRSLLLFRENPYCKGMIKRLLRNEINTGLKLEATPIAKILGMTEDEAQQWGEQRKFYVRTLGANQK